MFKKIQDAAKEAIDRQNKALDSVLKPQSASELTHKQKPVNNVVDLLADDDDIEDKAKLSTLQPIKPISAAPPTPSRPADSSGGSVNVQAYIVERQKIDKLLREITPLNGLTDFEMFENHLRSLIMQKSAANDEVKRLSAIVNDQKTQLKVINEQLTNAKDVQRLEATTKGELFQNIQKQLEMKEEEIFKLKQSKGKDVELEAKVQELASTVKKYSEKLTKMVDKAKQLQEENLKLKEKVDVSVPPTQADTQTGEELEKWRTRAKESTQLLKESMAREDDLKIKFQDFQQKIEALEREKEDLIGKFLNEKSLKESEQTGLAQKVELLSQENAELREKLSQSAVISSERLKQVEEENLKLSQEKADYLKERQEIISENEDKLSNLKKILDNLEDENNHLKASTNDQKLSGLIEENFNLKGELKDKLEELKEISQTFDNWKQERTHEVKFVEQETQALREKLTKEIHILSEKLMQAQGENSELKEKLSLAEREVTGIKSNEASKIAQLEEKLTQAQGENSELKEKLSLAEREVTGIKSNEASKISQLEEKLTQAQGENAELKKKVESMEQNESLKSSELMEENSELKKKLSLVESKFHQELSTIQKENSDLNNKCQNLNNDVSQLQKDNDKLREKLSDLQKDCEKSVEKSSMFDKENLQLKSAKEKLICEINELKQRLLSSETHLKDENSQLTQRINDYKTKLEKTVELVKQTRAQIQKLQSDCTSFQDENSTLREKVSTLTSDNLKIQGENKSLREGSEVQSEQTKTLISTLQQENSELKSRNQILEKEQEEKLSIVQQELEMSKKLFEQRSQEYLQLRDKLTEYETRLDATQETSRKYAQELEANMEKLKEDLRRESEKVQESEDQRSQLTSQLEMKNSQLEALEINLAENKRHLELMQRDKSGTEQELRKATEALQESERKFADCLIEIEKLKIKNSSSQKAQEEYSARVLEIQNQLEDYKSREEALKNVADGLKQELGAFKQEAEQFRHKGAKQTSDLISREYVKNVLLKFITDPAHRQQLVPVLSAIFLYSKEEQSKIVSSVGSMSIFDSIVSPVKRLSTQGGSSNNK